MACCGILLVAVATADATLPIRLFEAHTLYVRDVKCDACESRHGDTEHPRHSRIHVQLS
jgi:hypothetical protein